MNEISIIIPCLASLDGLTEFLDELAKYLMENPSDVEVIIVTNDSLDSAPPIADHIQNNYPWLKFRMLQRLGESRGYGALVRLGLACSTSRYIALVSPYGEDDIGIINKMLGLIRNGAQVVQVTRYSLAEDMETVQLRFRIYQHIYRFLTRVLTGYQISDSTYGFKMFDRVFIQALGLSQNGRSISPEITLKGLMAGGKVEYLSSGVRAREIGAKFKLFRDGFGYFWLLIRAVGHRMRIAWF